MSNFCKAVCMEQFLFSSKQGFRISTLITALGITYIQASSIEMSN